MKNLTLKYVTLMRYWHVNIYKLILEKNNVKNLNKSVE